MNIPQEQNRTDAELQWLVQSFLARKSSSVSKTNVVFKDRIVSVYEVQALGPVAGESDGRWLVCGDLPFVEFGKVELNTPEEAVALYALILREWIYCTSRGISGDFPEVLFVGTWEPVQLSPEYGSWLGPRLTYLDWNVIPRIGQRILHPEIRMKLRERGLPLTLEELDMISPQVEKSKENRKPE